MPFELIEASAGTGKTWSLTSRYLHLLLDSALAVDQILVVTFTEAATAELRDRIRVRIREVRDHCAAGTLAEIDDPAVRGLLETIAPAPGGLEKAVKRLTNAIISFDEAAIYTIHGFCRRVLREQAFATGMDFTAEVMTDDLPILETVVADFARSRLGDLSPEEFGWCVEHSVFFNGANENDWRVTGRLMKPGPLKTLHTMLGNPFLRIIPGAVPLAAARATGDPAAVALAMTHALIAHAREGLALRKREMRVMSFGDMLVNVHAALAGPGGDRLAGDLRRSYRAALIDEFQDTDPLQFDIIRRIYEGTGCPVVFVGDPKQAIYSFRGGDIFTYFRATAAIPAESRRSLPVNYRSAKDLVASVSAVFTSAGNASPFADGGLTLFPEVVAHHEGGKDPRQLPAGDGRAALHWLLLPADPGFVKGFTWTKTEAEAMVLPAIVGEIRRLIDASAGVPGALRPSDIAVLVRSHVQAGTIQKKLQAAGIPCIVKSPESVFASVAAGELLSLLRAVAHPGSDADVSAALLTPSLGHTAVDLAMLKQDMAAYGAIAERLIGLRSLWESSHSGFMRMASALLYEKGLAAGDRSVAERLLVYADAERRLTDMLHLIELLHQESILHPGRDHLVHWLEAQIAGAGEEKEETSIRLESDAERVQIVTVHMSKGLEYPVVFCPYTYEGKAFKLSEDDVVFYHDVSGPDGTAAPVLTADCGSPELEAHFHTRVQEARSESIRHLYVALTRARQRCYVVWGHVNNMEDAALAHVLFPEGQRDRKVLEALGHNGALAPVLGMVARSHGAMSSSIIDPGAAAGAVDGPAEDAGTELRARVFERGQLRPAWSYTSYTSLTSDWVRSKKDTDAAAGGVTRGPVSGTSIFAFPAGARTGKIWHAFFEHLDLRSGDEPVAIAVERTLARNAIDPAFGPAMSAMVRAVLDRPLGPAGFRLRDIDDRSCVRELDFVFGCRQFQTAGLRALLADPAYGVHARFAQAARTLRDRDVRGFMIGTIDLLLQHDGRFYLIDYKSNLLGDDPAHYREDLLVDAIAREHYYLQYLIYTVAVHRYLRTRVPGYAYESRFGGVLYLFLRGMAAGGADGVYFDRPPAALVEALEARIFTGEEA